jgi:hypothetical protein
MLSSDVKVRPVNTFIFHNIFFALHCKKIDFFKRTFNDLNQTNVILPFLKETNSSKILKNVLKNLKRPLTILLRVKLIGHLFDLGH